jgi:hypothetical protein
VSADICSPIRIRCALASEWAAFAPSYRDSSVGRSAVGRGSGSIRPYPVDEYPVDEYPVDEYPVVV